jgi:hypothetical protein
MFSDPCAHVGRIFNNKRIMEFQAAPGAGFLVERASMTPGTNFALTVSGNQRWVTEPSHTHLTSTAANHSPPSRADSYGGLQPYLHSPLSLLELCIFTRSLTPAAKRTGTYNAQYNCIWEVSCLNLVYPEDGGSEFLRNSGTYLPDHRVSHSTRPCQYPLT